MSWTLDSQTIEEATTITVTRPPLPLLIQGSDHKAYALVRYQGDSIRTSGPAEIAITWEHLTHEEAAKLEKLRGFGGRFQVSIDSLSYNEDAVNCETADYRTFYLPDCPVESVTVYEGGTDATSSYTIDADEGTATKDGASTTLSSDLTSGNTVLPVADASVFSVGDTVAIGGTYTEYLGAITAVNTTANTITVTTATGYDHDSGDEVYEAVSPSIEVTATYTWKPYVVITDLERGQDAQYPLHESYTLTLHEVA